MSTKEKAEILPSVCVDHDSEKYHIEIELPGVQKDKIHLEVNENSLCIRAPRDDLVYNACYTIAHAIEPSKTEALYEEGLLKVTAPLKSSLKGTVVKVK
jgi:HSP20 family protein